MQSSLSLYLAAARSGTAAVRAVLLDGPQSGAAITLTAQGKQTGSVGNAQDDAALLENLGMVLAQGEPARGRLALPLLGDVEVFVAVTRPPERLIIVGAVHTAIPLVTLANTLGFETVVIDNRTAFATPDRFGHAARLITCWPADALADLTLRADDSLVFLTHDAKIDNPALTMALLSPVRYIGALGSRKTHAARLESLREACAPTDQFDRIHAPVGLDLGGRTPEEIALAIMAQVVACRYGRN